MTEWTKSLVIINFMCMKPPPSISFASRPSAARVGQSTKSWSCWKALYPIRKALHWLMHSAQDLMSASHLPCTFPIRNSPTQREVWRQVGSLPYPSLDPVPDSFRVTVSDPEVPALAALLIELNVTSSLQSIRLQLSRCICRNLLPCLARK